MSELERIQQWPVTAGRTTSEVRELENRVAELEAVLGLVKKDLLLRAEHDDYGVEIVGLSSSVWLKLSNYLKEQDNE